MTDICLHIRQHKFKKLLKPRNTNGRRKTEENSQDQEEKHKKERKKERETFKSYANSKIFSSALYVINYDV
jgi:hypothetical protein